MNDELDLDIQTCEACHSGSPRLSGEEIERLRTHVPDWEVVEVDDVPRLTRTFHIKGWQEPVAFLNEVVRQAEENDHHPRIVLEWGSVEIEWWTHAIDGLHKNDFIMAAKVDKIASR